MNKWFYRVVVIRTEYERDTADVLTRNYPGENGIQKQLENYGQGGWELVSFLPTAQAYYAVFKQPGEPIDSPVEVMKRVFPEKYVSGE